MFFSCFVLFYFLNLSYFLRGQYYAKCFPSKADPAKIICDAGYAFLPDFYEHKRHAHKYKLYSPPDSSPSPPPSPPPIPPQAAALLVCAVPLIVHPTDEITPQEGALKDMQWAAREHQPPWMNPCYKPAPRFEVISSMTQIFLHA